jgi:hypothetical protein
MVPSGLLYCQETLNIAALRKRATLPPLQSGPSDTPTHKLLCDCRLQSRDRQGRRILPAAHAEKEAKDVWQDDPLQVCARREYPSISPPPPPSSWSHY